MTCRYLTFEDRQRLEEQYASGEKLTEIASSLKVHIATVYRELARGDTGKLDANGRSGYSAKIAQRAFQESIKRRGGKSKKTA